MGRQDVYLAIMPSARQKIGFHGEVRAREYLEKLGYRFIDQQWHCRYGELDLIMMEGDELVFVEVKLRAASDYGHPEDMVSWGKAGRLRKTALNFIQDRNCEEMFWRFDTIAITLQGNHYEILHLKDTIRNDRL